MKNKSIQTKGDLNPTLVKYMSKAVSIIGYEILVRGVDIKSIRYSSRKRFIFSVFDVDVMQSGVCGRLLRDRE